MTLPPMLRLPVELHQEIAKNLELQDRVCLRITNRFFLERFEQPKVEEFRAAETGPWALSKGLYTCNGCKRFRRLREFSDTMRKGKLARRGSQASERLCVKCGVDRRLYEPDTEVIIMGQRCVASQIYDAFNNLPDASALRITDRKNTNQDTADRHYDSEDDWEYSTRSRAEGRHIELIGVVRD
jgi:hypothetical protein